MLRDSEYKKIKNLIYNSESYSQDYKLKDL